MTRITPPAAPTPPPAATRRETISQNSRTLVLLAHPDLPGSRVNSALADAVRDLDGVTVRARTLIEHRGRVSHPRALVLNQRERPRVRGFARGR